MVNYKKSNRNELPKKKETQQLKQWNSDIYKLYIQRSQDQIFIPSFQHAINGLLSFGVSELFAIRTKEEDLRPSTSQ